MKNIDLAKTGYKKFADGDIEGVLDMFDPNIEWHECQGFPFIEGNGVFKGPEAVAKEVLNLIPEYYENFNIEIEELMECDDRVIMTGYYTGTWKATGKKFKANAVHVWTVKSEKLSRFFQAVDTATIVNPVKAKAM
ncbi:nuclear transport factor 2 family protein [Fodinibius salsisoli]|uniref:Nuclear transport factor 2 family protein n=1 Tax=Fodinibius salsisoli TaxID=2820877 RepID=A0ABT3PMW8_9BACT|nr:nuclear transport factor 2 family protein [Fodinibius salsisoli]MCW9707281.1 nuclear transport factor 2 family protein [Fodinibius salsisoli]